MNKKWLLGSAVLLLLVGSLLYWWPVLADTTHIENYTIPSTCPPSSKCIFNDNDNGALLIQTQNGDIDLKIATTTGSAGIYFNRRSTTTYGLVVKANGTLLHNGYPVVIADGGTYNINSINSITSDHSDESNISESLNYQYGEFLPRHVINQQIFTVYEDPIYFGFTEEPVIGLSSIYSYDSIQQPPLAGQLAFVRKGTGTTSTQQLQFRFNDSEFPLNWGPWREICDYSNNCHNFINVLDDSNTGDVVIYQDPDFLISSGLKITSTSSLVNCTVLSTVSGEIICGTSTPGGGDNLGNHIATQNIRLNDHWLSGDGGDEGVFVNSIGNVGIGTREPTTKLYVDGPTIVNGTLQVPNISAGIVKSGSGGTFTSVSAISSTDISSLTWSKLTNFPTACGTGQYVSGLSSSTLTCSTPTNTTYSAGNGLSLTGTTFSLAASGANNYITKWTGTNTLGTSTIYETNNNIGIGTTSLNEKLTVQGNIKVSSLAGTGSRCLYATAGGVISATTSDCGTSAGGDNLGNHIATKNIQLNGYWLSKDGDDEGVFVDKDGKVGIGTTSPATKLHIYDATSGPIITLSGLDTNYRGLTIKNTSNNEKWFVGNNTSNNFVIRATNTNDILTISSSNGNVGIGTTSSPSTKLDVNGSLAVRGSVSFTSSSYTGSNRLLMVDSFGNVSATSTAGVSMPSGNTGQTLRYGTSGWEATNNIYIDVNTGNVGIGSTTSPAGKLQVFGSTFLGKISGYPFNSLWTWESDGTGYYSGIGYQKYDGTNKKLFVWWTDNVLETNINSVLNVATPGHTFDGTAPNSGRTIGVKLSSSGNSYFNGGNVGIGTANPGITLAIGDNNTGLHRLGSNQLAIYSNNRARIEINPTDTTGITVRGNDNNTWATLKTTSSVITLTLGTGGADSKLDVGTVDPLYTIGGKRYATYMSGMTGVKEETSGVLNLDKNSAGLFMAKLDFAQSPVGSDLWLFGRTTNIINNQEHFNEITCLLTPNFSGETWYEKDWGSKSLTIFARPDNNQRERVEVSYRLTAPRFDSNSWNNYSSSESEGFNLDQLLK